MNVYNIFRWYRAGWGRYTQADPAWDPKRIYDLNPYAYVAGNPITSIDPWGLATLLCREVGTVVRGTYVQIPGSRHCRVQVVCDDDCPPTDVTVGLENVGPGRFDIKELPYPAGIGPEYSDNRPIGISGSEYQFARCVRAYNRLFDRGYTGSATRHVPAYSARYDAAGRVASVHDETHAAPNVHYSHDPAGRLASVTQTLGSGSTVTRYSYESSTCAARQRDELSRILLRIGHSDHGRRRTGGGDERRAVAVRRDDWVLQLIALLACALWWPHPLIWIAWRRFCVEAERACGAHRGCAVADRARRGRVGARPHEPRRSAHAVADGASRRFPGDRGTAAARRQEPACFH